MKHLIKYIIPAAVLLFTSGVSSCTGDLDVTPLDPNLSLDYDAEGLFNKCYSVFALEGNGGGGSMDIIANDAGFTGLVRQMWNSNELCTDEAICGWGDDGISSFVYNTYDANHNMLAMYYNRLTLGINYCNQYINNKGDYHKTMTAEIRLLRALMYYMLTDAFGNPPFGTELGVPSQRTRAEMFTWIENEVNEIIPDLREPKAKKSSDIAYGRLDKAAAWMLLMRLYLNAEVYTGTARWTDAADMARRVIATDYRLNMNPSVKQVPKKNANGDPLLDEDGNPITETWTYSAYQMLFMGDNGETDAAYEAIFPIMADGQKTQQWGCSQFLMASTYNADMFASKYDHRSTNGTGEAWAGNRARYDLAHKFFPQDNAPSGQCYDLAAAAKDDRALLCSEDHTMHATDPSEFKSGFGVAKFSNFRTDGSPSSHNTFADTDFFFFRLAECYLTLAECDARLHGGTTTNEGTAAINLLHRRANATERISGGYTLRDILDEWSKEFYFEGRRRVDLIRYGYFGGDNDYMWEWKGGALEGRQFGAYRNIFPLPSDDLTANKNLRQNPEYK